MILKKFEYSEYPNTPNSWSLKEFELGNINLFVGKNATGKTNTLTKIAWLGNMLAGKRPQLLDSGNYDVEFVHDDKTYLYKLNLQSNKVKYEELIEDGEQKFKREEDGTGKISAIQFPNEKMDFQLQMTQLVVTSKRDAYQHPFLEELSKWAWGQRVYAFGGAMGHQTFFVKNEETEVYVDPADVNGVVGLYMGGRLDPKRNFKKRIIDYMNRIGFELDDIDVSPVIVQLNSVNATSGYELYIREKNSSAIITQLRMSQGMFRALSLIIHIVFNTMMELSTTILIDDIGEGLDFDRSTKLIDLLIELATDNKYIQLIMSTNDRFVMNKVPLEYWQLIDREGGTCKVYNYKKYKNIFEEFRYTGLNNFDFLATDFIHSEWVQK